MKKLLFLLISALIVASFAEAGMRRGVVPPTLLGVTLSNNTFTCGTSGVVGAVTVQGVGSISAATLSLTGADSSQFTLSSTTVPSNLLVGTTPVGCPRSYNFNLVATLPGATSSLVSQAETVVGSGSSGPAISSLWKSTDTPATVDGADAQAGVYGVQFTPQTAGSVTGCKFYKAAANTGTHICTLWSNSGTQLATVTFAGETASGWQTQNFSSSVALTAGTQYVIGVYDPIGHYSVTQPFFSAQYTSDVDGQLTAPATGSTTNGHGNGVYVYTTTATTFPTNTFNSSNYWTDVVYQYTPVSQSIASLALSGNSILNSAPTGAVVGTVSAVMSPATPSFTGSFSLSTAAGGCNSTNGANNASFAISGSTLQTNVANIATGSYSICVLATQASATNNPKGQAFTITSAPQSITAVGLTSNSFFAGMAGAVGAASATLSPVTPAFTGTWSLQTTGSISGTTCDASGFFSFSGSTLNVTAAATTTTYHLCIVATQSGLTGSPFASLVNVIGTAGGNVAFSLPTGDVLHYLSPTGSDSNNGLTTGAPWLTPNHPMHCGDVIIAAAGSYTNQFNRSPNGWGTVTNCPSTTGGIDGAGGIWFATILCAGPDLESCPVDSGGNISAFDIQQQNFWAVEGFKATTRGADTSNQIVASYLVDSGQHVNSCAGVYHHVAFINDISYNASDGFSTTDCGQGFGVNNPGIDQFAVVGSIAQNSGQGNPGSGLCVAAIDDAGPAPFDTSVGAHVIFYGDFSYNEPGNGCPYDIENFMFDSWDVHNFTGTGVQLNNVGVTSYRMGIQIILQGEFTTTMGSLHQYVINNTMYNNNTVNGSDIGGSIQMTQQNSAAISQIVEKNIAANTQPTQCALLVGGASLVNIVLGATGSENIAFAGPGSSTCYYNGFPTGAPTPANFNVDPTFTNTTDLLANRIGVPNCTGFTNVTACMGWNANASSLTTPSFISDLTPSCTNCTGKGYQKPSVNCGPVNAPDGTALYPTWLKGIVYLHWNGSSITENADLVTKPCGM